LPPCMGQKSMEPGKRSSTVRMDKQFDGLHGISTLRLLKAKTIYGQGFWGQVELTRVFRTLQNGVILPEEVSNGKASDLQ
jgi:hypothetical protein